MTNDSAQFNLSIEPDIDDFDPLADFGPDDEDAENGAPGTPDLVEGGASGMPVATANLTALEQTNDRPAEERIDELFRQMAPRRTVLLGILGFCAEPQPVASVNALVDDLQENNFSVYTAANLCALLEKAGALERVTTDGQPCEDIEIEPKVVVVDGVEYLEAAEPPEACWLATAAGTAMVEADKPLERLHELFESDQPYLPIYKRVLAVCAADGGATTAALSDAVDSDPLVQKPRLYAPRFVDKLEKCDAITWKKAWLITEVGKAGLEMLADVEDASAPAQADDEACDSQGAQASE